MGSEIVKNPNYEFWVTNKVFGYITGIMALGAVFSALVSGYVRNMYGTKVTILIFNLPIIIGQTMIIFASNVAMVTKFKGMTTRILLIISFS